MTVVRALHGIFLEDACAVEDAEILLQDIGPETKFIDWSGCTHLHTACLQVILASRIPLRGTPSNAVLGRWLMPLLHVQSTSAETDSGKEMHAAASLGRE